MGKLVRFGTDKTVYLITPLGFRRVTSEADRDVLRLLGLADGTPGADANVQPADRQDAALAGIDFDKLRK